MYDDSGFYAINLENIVSIGVLVIYHGSLGDVIESCKDSGFGIDFQKPKSRRKNPRRRFVKGFYSKPKVGMIELIEGDLDSHLLLVNSGSDKYIAEDLIRMVDIIGATPVKSEMIYGFMGGRRTLIEKINEELYKYSDLKKRYVFRRIIEKAFESDL